MGLAKVGLVNTVNLGELDAFLLQSSRGLLVVRSQSLAMSTPIHRLDYTSSHSEAPIPWCEELDENERFGLDHGIKVLRGKTDDVRRVGGDERRKERDARRDQKAEPHALAVGGERKEGR